MYYTEAPGGGFVAAWREKERERGTMRGMYSIDPRGDERNELVLRQSSVSQSVGADYQALHRVEPLGGVARQTRSRLHLVYRLIQNCAHTLSCIEEKESTRACGAVMHEGRRKADNWRSDVA